MSALPPTVLTFAGSDPTSGAGLQADVLTLASMGCHPLSVVTALTIQDTRGVEDVMAIDSDWVNEQARKLLEDMPVAAFKLGILGSVENVTVIAEILADYPEIPVILDPVLSSGRGDPLATEDMITALRELIIPQSTVLTPNSLEVRRLTEQEDDRSEPPLEDCAARLIDLGCEYVLVTGTHENTSDVINTLYGESGLLRRDRWKRLPGTYHGSGCTLASALAATLANGLAVTDAVREAQEYTWQALAHGFRPGMGQHLPDRFFWARALGDADASPQRGQQPS